MKKIIISVAALIAGLGLRAEEASSYSVTADFSYTSAYVFRGVQQINGGAFQPSVTISNSNGFSFGVWTSHAIDTGYKNTLNGSTINNEVDVFASYTYKVNDKLSVVGGGTYYWYPQTKGGPVDDATYELNLGASYSLGSVALSGTYYHDFVNKSDTLQGGATYSIPLPDEKGTFDLSGFIGWNDIDEYLGVAGATESYGYAGLDAKVTYALTSASKLKVGATWSVTDNAGALTTDDDLFLYFSISAGL